MRYILLATLAIACLPVQTTAQDPAGKSNKSADEIIFSELADGLRRHKDEKRARSAMLELNYWHIHPWRWRQLRVHKPVMTKDGKSAQVVFLDVPGKSMPGRNFSMVFLLVEKRVVDWASCWTHTRIANQELMLEDVDGDGHADIAFRASEGFGGLHDKRQNRLPNDERIWLYAYAVTSEGFESLFPRTERELKVKLSYETAEQSVELLVEGLPETLREWEMVECTISVKNQSDKDIAIEPTGWFDVDVEKAGCKIVIFAADERTTLKPGESVSQAIYLLVEWAEKEEAALCCKFVPKEEVERSPFDSEDPSDRRSLFDE